MHSPILGPFGEENLKRTISELDQEYEMLGLSQHKAFDEESFLLDHGTSMAPFDDDFPMMDLRRHESLKVPYASTFEAHLNSQDPVQLLEAEGPYPDLPDTTNMGLRNRSMTFHYSANTLAVDLLNSLADPKNCAPRPGQSKPRLSFDYHENTL